MRSGRPGATTPRCATIRSRSAQRLLAIAARHPACSQDRAGRTVHQRRDDGIEPLTGLDTPAAGQAGLARNAAERRVAHIHHPRDHRATGFLRTSVAIERYASTALVWVAAHRSPEKGALFPSFRLAPPPRPSGDSCPGSGPGFLLDDLALERPRNRRRRRLVTRGTQVGLELPPVVSIDEYPEAAPRVRRVDRVAAADFFWVLDDLNDQSAPLSPRLRSRPEPALRSTCQQRSNLGISASGPRSTPSVKCRSSAEINMTAHDVHAARILYGLGSVIAIRNPRKAK